MHLTLVSNSLSLLEILLECVGEPLGVLHKLPLALLQSLLARGGGDQGGDLVHRVQQLLDGAGNLPEITEEEGEIRTLVVQIQFISAMLPT